MKRLLLVGVLAVTLLLALSVPALAAQPTTKDMGSNQLEVAYAELEGDCAGYVYVMEWNVNYPGQYREKSDWAEGSFDDSLADISISFFQTPLQPDWFTFSGKSLNKAELTMPAQFTYDGDEYAGTVEVRWEGVGDISPFSEKNRYRVPETGKWTELFKDRSRWASRAAVATITFTCHDLEYQKTCETETASLSWLFEHVVSFVR
jgi:hypothetical protein